MTFNLPLLLVGFAFFAFSILMLVKQLKSVKNNTASATARVVSYFTEISLSTDSDSADTTVYYPILRYCADNQSYEKKYDVGRGKQKYAIGEEVEIRYDPQHPENYIIAGDNSTTVASSIGIVIGIGVMILAFFAK